MYITTNPRIKSALRDGSFQSEIKNILQGAYDAVAMRYLEEVERLEADHEEMTEKLHREVEQGLLRDDQLKQELQALKGNHSYLKKTLDKKFLILKTDYYKKGLKEKLGPRSLLFLSLEKGLQNMGIELDLSYHLEMKTEKVFVDVKLSGPVENFNSAVDAWVKKHLGINKLKVIDNDRGRLYTYNQITQTRK